jgi:hypothetical protein
MRTVSGALCLAAVLIPSASQPASAQDVKSTVIFLMHDGIELETMRAFAREYKQWETSGINVLFRIQNKGRLLKETIDFCEEEEFPYLITAGSSDFVARPLAMKTIVNGGEKVWRLAGE